MRMLTLPSVRANTPAVRTPGRMGRYATTRRAASTLNCPSHQRYSGGHCTSKRPRSIPGHLHVGDACRRREGDPMRMRGTALWLTLFALVTPRAALAQTTGAIAGTIRDISGGVLPGVTVEASSP